MQKLDHLERIQIRIPESGVALQQKINACTLISISIIKAILEANNEQLSTDESLHDLVLITHTMGVSAFDAIVDANSEYIDVDQLRELQSGITEMEAYHKQPEIKAFFNQPTKTELTSPAGNDIVKEFIDNRNSFYDYLEFLSFNEPLIQAITKALPIYSSIDLSTASEAEIRAAIDSNPKPKLVEQIEAEINQLNNSGLTFCTDGHTISLTKRDQVFYSYDSLTGILTKTDNAQAMAEDILAKLHNVQSTTVHTFTPCLMQERLAIPHNASTTPSNSAKETSRVSSQSFFKPIASEHTTTVQQQLEAINQASVALQQQLSAMDHLSYAIRNGSLTNNLLEEMRDNPNIYTGTARELIDSLTQARPGAGNQRT